MPSAPTMTRSFCGWSSLRRRVQKSCRTLHSDDLGAYAPAVDGVFLGDEPCLVGVLAALWFARQHPAGDGADHASAVANLGRRGASVGLYQCGERGGVFPQRDSGCCGELDHGLPYGRVRAS